MATYATYFHLPSANGSTMVQHSTPKDASFTRPYNTIRLQGSPQGVPEAAAKNKDAASKSASTNHKTLPTSDQNSSLFFRLPAELRNQIYTELLCPDAPGPKAMSQQNTGKDLAYRHFNQTSTPTTLHPAILSTCRRIHEEAGELLYTHVFHAHPSLLTSLPHLTSPFKPVLFPSVLGLIDRWQISLRLDTDPRFTYAQASAAFSGAEYLEIRVWQAQFEACDYSALRLFAGVRGVGVARVGGSVDPKLAEWLEQVMMQPKEVEKQGELCGCDEACPGWSGRMERLCGGCYTKLGIEMMERQPALQGIRAR